jgi:hypothetical protein
VTGRTERYQKSGETAIPKISENILGPCSKSKMFENSPAHTGNLGGKSTLFYIYSMYVVHITHKNAYRSISTVYWLFKREANISKHAAQQHGNTGENLTIMYSKIFMKIFCSPLKIVARLTHILPGSLRDDGEVVA